eukprot:TRINITY_DN1670_c0_g2_i5.p1 TRINITY_DN1670_c0_g2~~TRINITY_DN1670_c0_g2_i5.p1  ORF type:complete len:381 (-),score=69.13 TRINITY_DN1670_c0_g2_i5:272-1414(-)
MNKKEATADHDLDQFLKELEDIEHGERELHKHLRQATQKIRESVNLDDLLRDIEEVRQDMIQNERELLSTPIYETSREFDVSQDKMLPMKKVEPAPKKEINVPEDPVEFLRELEVMNERRQEVHRHLQDIILANDKRNEEQAVKEARKDVVKAKLMSFQEQKTKVFDGLPNRYKFRVRALIDFDPRATYSQEESVTMLFFKKGSDIVVISCFTPDWLVGYVDLGPNNFSVVKMLPSTVVFPHYDSLPTPHRRYEISDWDSFGSAAEEVDFAAIEAIRQSVIFKSMHLNLLLRDALAKPKLVVAATRDFNVDPRIETVLEEKIPLLSFLKGDIIIVTKLANPAQWMEGYVINRPEIRLGLFPSPYVLELNIKKSAEPSSLL